MKKAPQKSAPILIEGDVEQNAVYLLRQFRYERGKLCGLFISTAQVCKKYHLTRQTVYRYIKKGLITIAFTHRAHYFDVRQIDRVFSHYHTGANTAA